MMLASIHHAHAIFLPPLPLSLPINPFDAVIHMQVSPLHKRFFVGCSSPLCDSANISRRIALGTSDVCLVCETDALRPDIAGMRGSIVMRLRPCMVLNTPSSKLTERVESPKYQV